MNATATATMVTVMWSLIKTDPLMMTVAKMEARLEAKLEATMEAKIIRTVIQVNAMTTVTVILTVMLVLAKMVTAAAAMFMSPPLIVK